MTCISSDDVKRALILLAYLQKLGVGVGGRQLALIDIRTSLVKP